MALNLDCHHEHKSNLPSNRFIVRLRQVLVKLRHSVERLTQRFVDNPGELGIFLEILTW